MFICDKDEHCIDCPKNYPEETCEHWIEVEQVSRGKWVFVDVTDDCVIRTDRCSICRETWDSFEKKMPPKYCPNCGAKMDGGKE